MPSHRYDTDFFDYIEHGARSSARVIVPLVHEALRPQSVLDVGCGRGIWAAEWSRSGMTSCIGVDGAYVERARLAIPQEHFVCADIATPFDLGRTFDLVQSLEVGEHIPRVAAQVFVGNLTRHAPLVLFSAAVPGQGGESHVNEQPYEYWRELFAGRGYAMLDPFRGTIARDGRIEPWYRYNTFLFAADSTLTQLPPRILHARVAEAMVRDVSPLSWRVRKAVLRHLPVSTVSRLARARAYIIKEFRSGN